MEQPSKLTRPLAMSVAALLMVQCQRTTSGEGTQQGRAPRADGNSGCAPREGSNATRPKLPRYWLQRASLSAVPKGPITHIVQGPVLVELAADGRVSSVPGSSETFAGYLPESMLDQPADRAGLMLYAQRTTDLHLDSKNGPIIGRLHPGAFVAVGVRGDGRAMVAVPRYLRTNATKERTLLAYVDMAALGSERIAEVAPTLPGRVVNDFPFSLHLREQWSAVDGLMCGELHIVEADGDTRATQYYRGIEVSGWIESAWYWGDHGPASCPARKVFRGLNRLVLFEGRDWLDARDVAAIPEDYLPIAPPAEDPLADAILHGRSLYWLTRSNGQLACRQWQPKARWLRAGQVGANGIYAVDVLEGELLARHDRLGMYFPMNYSPVAADKSGGSIELLGPYFKKTRTGFKCGVALQLLATRADVLFMERPGVYASGGGPPGDFQPVAFHPKDLEQWHLSRQSCDVARAAAVAAIEQDPATAQHLGLHIECNDQPP